MDYSKLKILAQSYADISNATDSEVEALSRMLWEGSPPEETASKPNTPGQKYTQEIPGYQRVLTTPSTEIQQKAQKILNEVRNKPFGTQVPFNIDGTEYMAVLEEHVGGVVPGPHPGISVFVKRTDNKFTDRTNKMLATLNPAFRPMVEKLLQEATKKGLKPEIVSAYRTKEEQQKIYEQGRTTKGTVITYAKPGISLHNYGLAVDLAALDNTGNMYYPDASFYSKLADIAKSLGMKWGGDFGKGDYGHFQFPTTAAKLQA